MTAAADPLIAAVVSVAGFDLSVVARADRLARQSYVDMFQTELGPLRGTSGEALVAEVEAAGPAWELGGLASRLVDRPVLLIGSGRDPVVNSGGRAPPTRRRRVPSPRRPAGAHRLRLSKIMRVWSLLLRPNRALLVLDTSGSMAEPVPGTTTSRMQLLQGAAIEGITLLTNETAVGLWEFSSRLTPSTDYRELVPIGTSNELIAAVDRRQALFAAVRGLRPVGGTGLYDTVYAAYVELQRSWQPGARNILVVITDGRNEDDDGLTLDQLTNSLRSAAQPDRPLPFIALAVGPHADAKALEEIAKITGGRVFVARNEQDAIAQIVLAFAGRISDE